MNKLRAVILAGLMLALSTIPAYASTDTIAAPGQWASNDVGIVWVNTQVGYLIYTNGAPTAADLVWIKTIDGGTTWSAPTTIEADNPVTTCETAPGLSVWFDQWTKGDAGTRIHIAWHHNSDAGSSCSNAGTNDNISYTYLDTANDVLGSTVVTLVTAYNGACLTGGNTCSVSITKAVNGNLYIYALPTTSAFQARFLKSIDDGATWSSQSLGVGGTRFVGIISSAAVDADILGIGTGNIIAITMSAEVLWYNDVTGIWTELDNFTTEIGSFCSTTAGAIRKCMSRAVNTHFTSVSAGTVGGTFFGILSDSVLANPHTLYVIRVNTALVPSLATSAFVNVTDINSIGMTFDNNTDRLYAFYLNQTTDQVVYYTSDDYAVTWSAATQFDDSVNAKSDVLTSPTLTRSGARVMPVWEESTDLITNLGNAITTSAEIVPDDQDFDNKIVRFVDGLGLRGNSGKMGFTALGGALLALMLIFRAPVIVFLSLEMLWFGAMAAITFVTPGLFLTLLTIFGVLMIFAILAKLNGDGSKLE